MLLVGITIANLVGCVDVDGEGPTGQAVVRRRFGFGFGWVEAIESGCRLTRQFIDLFLLEASRFWGLLRIH
jgi:hypothetical protein